MFWYSKFSTGDTMDYKKTYDNIFNDINNIVYSKETSKFEKVISLLSDKYQYDLTKIQDYEYLKECIHNYLNDKAEFNNLFKLKKNNKIVDINELEMCKNLLISEDKLNQLINMLCHIVIAKEEIEEIKLKKIEENYEQFKKEYIKSCNEIKERKSKEKMAILYEENQNHFDKRI